MTAPTTNPCPPSTWNVFFAKRSYGENRSPLITCPKCRRPRRDLGGPHAPHWRAGILVDCVGEPIDVVAGCGAAGNPPTPRDAGHESPAAMSSPGAGPGRGAAGSPSTGPLPAILPKPCESPGPALHSQDAELERVTSRLGKAILDFCRPGRRFHAAELHAHVLGVCEAAPASADRVMRELRAAGVVPVKCIDRSKSLYIVEGNSDGSAAHASP